MVAGILADVRTFQAFDCRDASVVTSITFQNSRRVYGFIHQTGETVREQLEPILEEFEVAAVKIGMVPTPEVANAIAAALTSHNAPNIVIDPVIRSSSGFDLVNDDSVKAIMSDLFPIATLVTPNVPEAERLSGVIITDEDQLRRAAVAIQLKGAANVLIKGGHFEPGSPTSLDFLFTDDDVLVFEAPRIQDIELRGTGCMLSSAIAANLANGKDLPDAVESAKTYVRNLILDAAQRSEKAAS